MTHVLMLGAQGRLLVPVAARDEMNIRPGDPLLLRVADGRAELVPLALVPRDQLWFYADAIQDRVQSAEESFLTPGPEPTPEPGAFEQSPAFEQSLATADPRARDQILRALKRLRRDPDSLALRIRPRHRARRLPRRQLDPR